jgi:hypothetical protein
MPDEQPDASCVSQRTTGSAGRGFTVRRFGLHAPGHFVRPFVNLGNPQRTSSDIEQRGVRTREVSAMCRRDTRFTVTIRGRLTPGAIKEDFMSAADAKNSDLDRNKIQNPHLSPRRSSRHLHIPST